MAEVETRNEAATALGQDIFDAVTDKAPPAETKAVPDPAPEPQASPEKPEREDNRDELGRFKAASEPAADPEAARQAPAQPADEPTRERIPLPEYLSVRERAQRAEAERDAIRQEMERQAADLRRQMRELQTQVSERNQPKAEVPDPIADPDGYRQHFETTLETRVRQLAQRQSFELAEIRHGEVFVKAYEDMISRAERGDTSIVNHVMGQPNPGAALVQWYKREQAVSRLGSDPDKYDQGVLDKALQDPAFLARAIEAAKQRATGNAAANGTTSGNRAPVLDLPPSLVKAPGSAAADRLSPMDGQAMFDHIVPR